MESVFEIVRSIIDRKRLEQRRPLHALNIEISQIYGKDDMQVELDKLVAVKILIRGRTINHDYYRINGMDEE